MYHSNFKYLKASINSLNISKLKVNENEHQSQQQN